MRLAVVLGSTREGRISERLAKWIASEASAARADVELVDLKDYPMPFFNEPKSPRFNPERKIDPAAQKWLSRISAAEAYIFVTPEYNHSIPGVLKNALDYITWEMLRKPATVVAHGTVGGARATMHLKEILSESRAVVIPTQIAVIGLHEKIDEGGNLSELEKAAEYGLHARAKAVLDDLNWYSDALSAARSKN